MLVTLHCYSSCSSYSACKKPLSFSLRSRRSLSSPSSSWKRINRAFSFPVQYSMVSPSDQDFSWIDFSKLPPSHTSILTSLLSNLETQLGNHLNPCLTPPDVRYFKNPQGNSEGSVNMRSGKEDSKVNYILCSWLHSELPFGVLDITTLSCMLNTKTDTPHFLLEIIQNSPFSAVVLLDLIPRKDFACNPNYLNKFYDETKLDSFRQQLEKLPEVQRYVSPVLYIRCVFSPTAIFAKIDTSGSCSMEEFVDNHVSVAAEELMKIWLEMYFHERDLKEEEKEKMAERDRLINSMGIEIDLVSNMPKLFGSEISDRVVAAIRKGV